MQALVRNGLYAKQEVTGADPARLIYSTYVMKSTSIKLAWGELAPFRWADHTSRAPHGVWVRNARAANRPKSSTPTNAGPHVTDTLALFPTFHPLPSVASFHLSMLYLAGTGSGWAGRTRPGHTCRGTVRMVRPAVALAGFAAALCDDYYVIVLLLTGGSLHRATTGNHYIVMLLIISLLLLSASSAYVITTSLAPPCRACCERYGSIRRACRGHTRRNEAHRTVSP